MFEFYLKLLANDTAAVITYHLWNVAVSVSTIIHDPILTIYKLNTQCHLVQFSPICGFYLVAGSDLETDTGVQLQWPADIRAGGWL